jgi:hypothetical protein
MAGIGINGDCLPHPDNRLTLSDETDAFGQRKARIDFSYQANERAIDAHSRRTMTAIWDAAGLATSSRSTVRPTPSAPAAWATMATRLWSMPMAAASTFPTC